MVGSLKWANKNAESGVSAMQPFFGSLFLLSLPPLYLHNFPFPFAFITIPPTATHRLASNQQTTSRAEPSENNQPWEDHEKLLFHSPKQHSSSFHCFSERTQNRVQRKGGKGGGGGDRDRKWAGGGRSAVSNQQLTAYQAHCSVHSFPTQPSSTPKQSNRIFR